MRFLLILPAYNVEDKLSQVLGEIFKIVRKQDIVVVNDGSSDMTSAIAEKMGVRVISHNKNFGKGSAHKTGFRLALEEDYEAVATIDADGQHDPSFIVSALEKSSRDVCDIIIGSRWNGLMRMPYIRRFSNRITSLIISLLIGKKIEDTQSGCRFIRAEILRAVKLNTNRYDTESELLIKAGKVGFNIETVPISTIYDSEKSHVNPFIDTLRFVLLTIRSFWMF